MGAETNGLGAAGGLRAEFGGFSFRGRSKGQSKREQTIVHGRGSGSAMKDKAHGVVDLF